MSFDAFKNKVTDALKSEEQTDAALDKAAEFLNDKTGGKHRDNIAKGRDFLDSKVGEEGSRPTATTSEKTSEKTGDA